jgi:multiple sugar transport system permease protein
VQRRGRRIARTPGSRLLAALFLAPALVFVVGVIAYPIGLEAWLSLTDASPGQDGSFVGLANYSYLVGQPYYLQALANSAVYTVSSTLIKAVLGIAMALALARDFRGRRLVYALCFLPFVFPASVGTAAWYYLLSNVHGAFNYALLAAHLITSQVAFLGSGPGPMLSVITVNVWHGTALFGILCLAALRSIPGSLLDAAATDGATGPQRFLRIQLPLLRPALLLAGILSVVGNFGDFPIIYLLTGGGPLGKTEIVSTFAFSTALNAGDIGTGAAIALSVIPVYLAVLLVAFRLIEVGER